MRQAEVQSRFLDSFEELYPRIGFRGMQGLLHRAHDPYGFVLRVALGKAGTEVELVCAVLGDGYPQTVKRTLRHIASAEGAPARNGAVPVLIAPYLSEESRAMCREADVGYFDLAGNAGLETRRVLLEISGKTSEQAQPKRVHALFEGKAERLVRTLLFNASEKRWRMRELAQAASVSLGMASMVTSALSEIGVVNKSRTGLDLQDPAKLLDAWKDRYDVRRSAFRLYRSWADAIALERRLVEHREALEGRCALTLWSGAYHLLGWSNPTSRLALYWLDEPGKLARMLHLNEEAGRTFMFVFQPYDESLLWGAKAGPSGLPMVHPIQVYLDLASGDKEEVRLAQRVRERLLPW